MNRRHPYRVMERESVTGDMSLRELCRKHNISAHSLVVAQAQKHDWGAKREADGAKESESFIEKHADRMADRQAEIRDKALDAIDEALDKFRSDMRATEMKRIDGEWVEVPVMRLKPNDVPHPDRPPAGAVREALHDQPTPGPHRHLGAVGRELERLA